ncbi:electron transport complex subunit RsxG [Thiohalorhabdus methylotrophus]|uniref:Ion-translocating oxidoreductase complex subunit G n=1 Tax=Thiohalorhabdus methylotrophus TaxID=3242694 RepID=A0ABV4TQX8_9GAMM
MKQVWIVGGILALIAVVGAGLLAGTKQVTEPTIKANLRADRLAQLHELIPHGRYDNDLLQDTIKVRDQAHLGATAPITVYRARKDGEPSAVAFRTIAPDGYNGRIELLVAIWADGSLAGVRAISHAETPGLGDRIETAKSDWIRQFSGHSLGTPPAGEWKVEKDNGAFDQMTGATITSRAVVEAVRKALEFYSLRGREVLFAESGSKTAAKD